MVLGRRKEASAHRGNDKARAGSAPVPRRVSFPGGECEEGRTLRGNAGTQAGRSCIGLWAGGAPWAEEAGLIETSAPGESQTYTSSALTL